MPGYGRYEESDIERRSNQFRKENQYTAETGEEIKITAYYDGMELIEKYDTTY